MSKTWISHPVTHGLQARLHAPGDKSVSHRALIFASLAEGTSHIRGFLESQDTQATARIFSAMGVRIESPRSGERVVTGVGMNGLKASSEKLDCGNAGTGMRLLAGLLAGQAFDSTLIGDASLSRRPMRRITEPLASMGAKVVTGDLGCPPLYITGKQKLKSKQHTPQVASAQVKSAILLAGLYADGVTEVKELKPTRDYTERMLQSFGADVAFEPGWVKLTPGRTLYAQDVTVPADFSSAAFFIVAAAITPGSYICLENTGLNPRRTGLLEALNLMGADIRIENKRTVAGETMGDVHVRYAKLKGVCIPASLVSDMIDEFPALFIAAACAEGVTQVSGAAELRVKESDRIAGMAAGLRTLGVDIEETPDGARIRGGTIHGGEVDSLDDHRLAMSFALAGLVAEEPVTIKGADIVATSFPDFELLASRSGFELETV